MNCFGCKRCKKCKKCFKSKNNKDSSFTTGVPRPKTHESQESFRYSVPGPCHLPQDELCRRVSLDLLSDEEVEKLRSVTALITPSPFLGNKSPTLKGFDVALSSHRLKHRKSRGSINIFAFPRTSQHPPASSSSSSLSSSSSKLSVKNPLSEIKQTPYKK